MAFWYYCFSSFSETLKVESLGFWELGKVISYVCMEPTSSSILIESMSLLSSMVVGEISKFSYYLWTWNRFFKVKWRINYITQLRIKGIKVLIFMYPNILKFSGKHLQFRNFNSKRTFISDLIPCFLSMITVCYPSKLIWTKSIKDTK